jgi:hypothetical protein
MFAFRLLLVSIVGIVVVYTGFVGATQGWNFMSVFFRDIVAMTWPGQFNLDFSCFLLLSGLWLAWRHHFSPSGLALGFAALFGGSPLLATYLFVASIQAKGNVEVLLLGKVRAAA